MILIPLPPNVFIGQQAEWPLSGRPLTAQIMGNLFITRLSLVQRIVPNAPPGRLDILPYTNLPRPGIVKRRPAIRYNPYDLGHTEAP